MEKPSYKLVGAPCGHHGQYTFYKAIRLTGPKEKIVAIGDFFFVRIWQDSELVSIGELQLLWTDRVSDQTLVSLRLYFLPENTPDGRCLHGEDEVLAINDKVVLKAEDLLSWVCNGAGWRWGLRAVWRGACAPPSDPKLTAPLHHTKLDFSDIDREKSAITIDVDDPGVVVFSYPRYCRYRALVARLEGIQADWLRDSLVAALGGYAAPSRNTRILYCKDTFEYPELEGHEFVCNHLAPKLKGRPRGRRRRAARSRDRSMDRSPDSRSSDSDVIAPETRTPRRLSLRNGPEKQSEEDEEDKSPEELVKDEAFLQEIRDFLKHKTEIKLSHSVKNVSLRSLYAWVSRAGGFSRCRQQLWRRRYGERAAAASAVYQRYLLQYERWKGKKYTRTTNGKLQEPKTIDTIDVTDSPIREVETKHGLSEKRLRTPSPRPESKEKKEKIEKLEKDILHLDNETGEVTKEELNITSKPAEELNREFLESLRNPEEEKVKIFVKPVEKLLEPSLECEKKGVFFGDLTQKMNLGSSDPHFLHNLSQTQTDCLSSLSSLSSLQEKYTNGHTTEPVKSRPVGRSSLRAVRVKPARVVPAPVSLAESSSSPTLNNFGIHHPPSTHSDDEIVEVPYKPKSPEIIDLDEYPESPQGIKKKKLEILKERGLEVTAVPPAPIWPQSPINPLIAPAPIILNSTIQHQIMTQAQIFQMYNIIPPTFPNGVQAPKVIQASSAFGTLGPEKTVYGNPKDPFMPPPHVLQGTPIKPQRSIQTPPAAPQDILDLTCKTQTSPVQKPDVEIVRVASTPSPSKTPNSTNTPQNLSKSYTLIDGKAVVGSNLEITLVNAKSQTPPKRPPQKRSSNGKFVSAKTPTPPKDYPKPFSCPKKPPITVPNYQISNRESPTSSKEPNTFKGSNLSQMMEMQKSVPSANPFMDPLYVSALYNTLGPLEQRRLALYRGLGGLLDGHR